MNMKFENMLDDLNEVMDTMRDEYLQRELDKLAEIRAYIEEQARKEGVDPQSRFRVEKW